MNRLDMHVLTLFPEMIESFLRFGILQRAAERDLIRISTADIRKFAVDRYGSVDDTPYGGGAGMVMRADVLAACLDSLDPIKEGRGIPVIYCPRRGGVSTRIMRTA